MTHFPAAVAVAALDGGTVTHRMGFGPAQPIVSLRESIERSVSAAIVAGTVPAGELLTVPALAAQFEVSATPVREAMLNLQKLGFVDPVRNKGFRVTAVSVQDLAEIVEVRRLLEIPVVAGLADAYPEAEDARLREIARSIVEAAARSDMAAYLEADVEFHTELVAIGGNVRLTELVRELRRQTRLTGLNGMQGSAELAESAAEHERLLDLLRAGDRAGAEALMHLHIGHVLGWWAGNAEDD